MSRLSRLSLARLGIVVGAACSASIIAGACSANTTAGPHTSPERVAERDQPPNRGTAGAPTMPGPITTPMRPPAPPPPPVPVAPPTPAPKLACAAGTTAKRAAPPDPTWACTRPDGLRDGPFITPFPDGAPEIAGTYAAGILDGAWERHYAGGALAESGTYKTGQLDGHWKQLDPAGVVASESDLVAGTGMLHRWFVNGMRRDLPLKAGVPHGASTTWAPDGTVLVKERFYKGKLDGERTSGNRKSIYILDHWGGGTHDGTRTVQRFGVPFLDEIYDHAGRFDGLWTTWRDKGVPRISGTYDHGHRDGVWTWTDRDNNKEREGTYIKGQRDGVWTEWTENAPTLVGSYVNGHQDGAWIVTDKSGAEIGRYDMTDGSGVVLNFWPNKKVASKTTMYKGSQDGPYLEYSSRGKVQIEGHYSGDRKHGTWKALDEAGSVVSESHWRRGKLDKAIVKNVNGAPAMQATFKDGRATGAYTELRDGKPAVTGQFIDDKRDGTWTEYAPDGSVRVVSTYKVGVLDGPWHQVIAGITLDGQLEAGRRAGTWKRTDKAGNVTTIVY